MRRLPLLSALLLATSACTGMPTRNATATTPTALPPPAAATQAHTPAPAPAPVALNDGSLYQPGTALALFEDRRARRIGDVITIKLVERTLAQKSAKTSTSKTGETTMSGPTLLGRPVTVGGTPILDTSISGDRSFDGSGESSQSNKLEGTVTVTVSEVYANGSLRVRGEKRMTLNQGEEQVQIEGVVRPEDIAPDNTVPSSRVADVQINYSGRGALADANSQGWLSRFFNSPLWPF